jgi:ribosomal protein S18 acetylase RimI-like enzyme
MPSQVQLQTLDDPRVIERIRVLDKYCFPVKYSDDYYVNTVGRFVKHEPEKKWTPLNSVAFFADMLVGSITSRLEALMSEDDQGKTPVPDKVRCYIMTLGVLAPYRRMGIARQLVQRVIDFVATLDPNVEEIGLHVQQGSSALAFYTALGFEIRYEVKGYYTDIEPTLDAFYVCVKRADYHRIK